MPKWLKVVLVVLGALFALAIVVSFMGPDDDKRSLSFSEVIEQARAGNVKQIDVRGTRLDVEIEGDAEEYRSRIGRNVDFAATLREEGVDLGADGIEIRFHEGSAGALWVSLLVGLAPFVAFVAVIYLAIRNAIREGIRQGRRDE